MNIYRCRRTPLVAAFTCVIVLYMCYLVLQRLLTSYGSRLNCSQSSLKVSVTPSRLLGALTTPHASSPRVPLNGTTEMPNNRSNSTVKEETGLPPMLLEGPGKFISMNNPEWSANTLLFGHIKDSVGYLTIGIPVVKRKLEGKLYVYSTLTSIIRATTDRDKENITVVVFLSDFDKAWNLDSSQQLKENFSRYIEMGFLQVIHSPLNIYPEMGESVNFDEDSKNRRIWRSKQNIDFAYLQWYSKDLSQYYLQLEDDVIAAGDFYSDIKAFIDTNFQIPWVTLDFSRLGSIGKLFRSETLPRFATHLLTMFNMLPGDLLLSSFRGLYRKVSPIHYPRGLFQHIGKISSLKGKLSPLTDFTFKDSFNFSSFDIHGENPPAKLFTNMAAAPGSLPEHAYSETKKNSFFIVENMRAQTYYKLIYSMPMNISRIIVSTGNPVLRTGIMKWGIVRVGLSIKEEECELTHLVGRLFEGEFDSEIQEYTIPSNVMCISLGSSRSEPKPVIIRKIRVILS